MRVKTSLFVAVIALGQAAHADPIVYDNSTGLEWLNLSYTIGDSVQDAQAIPGWSVATTAQLGQFLTDELGRSFTAGTNVGYGDWQGVDSLLNAWGYTEYDLGEQNYLAFALTQNTEFPQYETLSAVDAFVGDQFATTFLGDDNKCATQECFSNSVELDGAAVALVAEIPPASTAPAPVPEPGVLCVMLSGLLGLAYYRRQKSPGAT